MQMRKRAGSCLAHQKDTLNLPMSNNTFSTHLFNWWEVFSTGTYDYVAVIFHFPLKHCIHWPLFDLCMGHKGQYTKGYFSEGTRVEMISDD